MPRGGGVQILCYCSNKHPEHLFETHVQVQHTQSKSSRFCIGNERRAKKGGESFTLGSAPKVGD
jgi:hypothetical protein